MRVKRGRTKKLTVAFHFQRSRQAAWKCEPCRESGLDRERRCGYRAEDELGPKRVVWVGGGMAVERCPKSLVSAGSVRWMEEFAVWRACGKPDVRADEARTAEAMLLLEGEWARGEER